LAAQQGWAVAVNYTRDALAADHVVQEIRAMGGQAQAFQADVGIEADIERLFQSVDKDMGVLSGLVNNAGGQYRAALHTISTKGFEAVVRNNLTGGFIFMREVYNRWMKDNGGAMVNIIADMWNGWPNFGHSGAARGGMLTLSESAACEWAESGVRVNTVAPGGIASSGFDRYTPEAQVEIRKYATKVPLCRFGTEAEVSAAIVFLLSPAAAYITGSCIRVDGGTPNARQTYELRTHERNLPFNGFHRAVAPAMLSDM
jgi:citronellol/citronellal dehydrogenase